MKEQKRYDAAVYCRLSKEDGESSSIATQKMILGNHVINNGWSIFDYYIDDGHTGTNFKRQGFERMLEDIDNGKVNMVIVKDLSRLGRSHIEADTFWEIYFPERNVRVIAVDDNLDSLKMEENNNDFIVPMKNMLNELYSRDLSKKVRSAVRAKKQQGEFLSNYAPIGYQKDPENKNRLLIEESGAEIVRRIFELCQSGMGSKKIAKMFNQEGVLSPRNHRNQLMNQPSAKNYIWEAPVVISILRNRTYVGDTVQGTYQCSRFKKTPSKIKPKEEWIITPNTHEPIIDLDTWEYVQKCIDARVRPVKNNVIQLFGGFLKCEDCGYTMGYSFSQGIEHYTCGTYRRHGRKSCSCHYIRKDVLEQVVLDDIRKYSTLAKDKSNELIRQLGALSGTKDAGSIKALTTGLTRLNKRNEQLDVILKRLYEDNISGRLSDDRFDKFLKQYEKEQSDIQARIKESEKTLEDFKSNQADTSSWINLIKNYTEIKELDRTVLSELVDKITIGEAKELDGQKITDITIYYRFVGALS